MPFKTTFLLLTASLALHALVVSFYAPGWQQKDPTDPFVDISYVHYAKEVPHDVIPQIKYPPVVKNQSRTQNPNPEMIPRPRAVENRQEESAPAAPVALPPAGSFKVRKSEEFLTDPHKGKVFLNYFGLIKQRVRRAVEKKYSSERMGRGSVSLMFILKSTGAVVNVFVVEKDSSVDEVMKDFAVRCVQDCSPFPHFPKELGMDRVSFNLSILFDEF